MIHVREPSTEVLLIWGLIPQDVTSALLEITSRGDYLIDFKFLFRRKRASNIGTFGIRFFLRKFRFLTSIINIRRLS